MATTRGAVSDQSSNNGLKHCRGTCHTQKGQPLRAVLFLRVTIVRDQLHLPLGRLQGLLDIGNDVVDILQADGEPDEVRRDAGCRLFLFG